MLNVHRANERSYRVLRVCTALAALFRITIPKTSTMFLLSWHNIEQARQTQHGGFVCGTRLDDILRIVGWLDARQSRNLRTHDS
jgi:hypothetical protein